MPPTATYFHMASNVCLGSGYRLADLTAIKPNADLKAGHADDSSTAAATAHVSDRVFFQSVSCNIVHMFMHQSADLWLARVLTCHQHQPLQVHASNSGVIWV